MRARAWAPAVALAALGGCGGGGGDGGSGFTAVVDGKAWAAEPVGVTARAGGVAGGIVVVGAQTANGQTRSLTISLNDITGPGRYPLGVGPGVYGGRGSVGEAPAGNSNATVWETPLSGVAGSIDITTLSADHLVATFAYDTEPDRRNMQGGTRKVTAGKIDLPLMGTLPAVPENQGSRLSATVEGKSYNAASVSAGLMDITGGAGVIIDSHSTEHAVSISLSMVSMPGTYTFSNRAPVRAVTAGTNGDPDHCCWGNVPGDEIMVTITSLTSSRIKGTFTGTLQPQPGKRATAPLVITDGAFDVGTAP
jgi:hypothetical protein